MIVFFFGISSTMASKNCHLNVDTWIIVTICNLSYHHIASGPEAPNFDNTDLGFPSIKPFGLLLGIYFLRISKSGLV
jgi:hypothetical protein